jgi:hypothetical protein
MAVSQYTVSTLPVESFLRGCVGYSVSDETLMAIFLKREVEFGTPAMTLTPKTRELCTADLYIYCASLPSTSGSVEDADAGWRHKEGGTQKSLSDTGKLIAMANEIYRKYGEIPSGSTIKMKPYGMKLW